MLLRLFIEMEKESGIMMRKIKRRKNSRLNRRDTMLDYSHTSLVTLLAFGIQLAVANLCDCDVGERVSGRGNASKWYQV
ncbi:hypothetical protein K435DRAFT_341920 [Dendrothele bispora CBS 962.96]|uniref:Uncharacterized protein n=1 Tax=Dendrothele bispora (strain CBS 962.96) TaxID=1314807 RepID=A0A4S8LG17_DENBC|nr:hypothetical protein K435DRAFT_341920 [Dendrothele bispora CBS 962.96]